LLDHEQLSHSSFSKRGTRERDGHDGGGCACGQYEEQLERVAENIDLTQRLGWEAKAKVSEIHDGGTLQDDEFTSR